ncbi:MAG: tetratricopeptide repeat protein [Tepidisphaeraceae bacterium]
MLGANGRSKGCGLYKSFTAAQDAVGISTSRTDLTRSDHTFPRLSATTASWCAVLIFAATLIAFWPVLRADFVDWDDFATVASNPRIAHPTGESLAFFWREPFLDLYSPLTCTVWWMIARATPGESVTLNPAIYHGVNVAMHILSGLIVFAILRRLVNQDAAACAGAMVFALHPLQVESVAWVSGLKDVLCGLLSLLAIWQYLCSVRQAHRVTRRVQYALALVAAIGAMLSKPTAVVVPILILTADVLARKRPWRSAVRSCAPFAIVAIVGAVIAARVQTAPNLTTAVSPMLRPLVAMDAIAFYLCKLVLPINLGLDYGQTPRRVAETGRLWFTWIVPVIAGAVVWLLRRRAPLLLLGACWFVAPLLPVLGFVSFDFQEFSTVADHYMYLPMLGVALSVAALVARVGIASLAVVAPAIVALGALAHHQCNFWLNSRSLNTRAVQVNPRAWYSLNRLAGYALEDGDHDLALTYARRSVDLKPTDADNHVNLGAALLAQRRLLDALPHLEFAISRKPASLEGHLNLGNCYAGLGRFNDAVREFEAAVTLDPKSGHASALLERARAFQRSR